MNSGQKSLRLLVEKWLSPACTNQVRVTRLNRAPSDQRNCVRVEIIRPDGPISIFFFRHTDGTWSVFPRETQRLAIGVCRTAA
jgi:hypothetical protein